MTTATATWEGLLRTPHPCDHLVQLYTDDAFLARAVAHFVGVGLAQGEAAVIIAIPAHVALFTERLRKAGVDVAAALAREQLLVFDAHACLAAFMVDGTPDRADFFSLVMPVLERARAAGFARIRFYGEMVNLLWDHNLEATVKLEELWNEVLAEQGVCLLCAYRIDNFDRHAHRGVLHQITRCHSHFIPVDDYERLDRAVDRAYADVFGARAETHNLRELMVSTSPPAAQMPSAQVALFALRALPPSIADAVLERTRHYYSA